MNPSEATLARFEGGFWEGFSAVCEEYREKATRRLKKAPPIDPVEVATAQREVSFWENDIPNLRKSIEEYQAKQAAARQLRQNK